MNTSDNFRKIALGWLVLGLMGLMFVAIFAVGHYIFGVPVHEGHSDRLQSPTLVAETLIVMGTGFAIFAVAGGWVFFRGKKG